ncbi:adenylyltransferase/cytidyltransferase family protein [Candidatus Pelagibacter sp.]|nr:adenylyltransferase/cytidyltransferase family protein [Candidatus Pelagibacter sp.]
MKKKIFFNLKRPYVFVPMSADFLHHGHINILVKSNKFGNIVVGLMTNAGIKSYKKRLPFFDYNQRKKVLEEIKCIKKIIPLNGLEYAKTAKKYQLDFFVHGNDWIKGPQSKERQILIETMRKWNGKVLEFEYTKGVSSSKIKNNLLNTKK